MNFRSAALIHLPKKVEFSSEIQSIPLPTNCASLENRDVVAMGNGVTGNDANISLQLKYAELKIIPQNLCNDIFPILLGRESVICAFSERKQSVCSGDSGGPLVSVEDGTLIGISAFVHKCKIFETYFYLQNANHLKSIFYFVLKTVGCELGIPQGFTNICSYLSWIKKLTESERERINFRIFGTNSSRKISSNLINAVLLSSLIYVKSFLMSM